MKQQVSLSLSKEILAKIDLERGLAPRSAYVEAILHKFFEEKRSELKKSLNIGKPFSFKAERSDTYIFR